MSVFARQIIHNYNENPKHLIGQELLLYNHQRLTHNYFFNLEL
jgi:hypothetical protein